MILLAFQAHALTNPTGNRHVHNDIEFLVVQRGRGRQLTGTGDIPCVPGDVFVYPIGCPHMSATGRDETFSAVVLNVASGELPAEAGVLLGRISDLAAQSNRLPVRSSTGQRVAALLHRAEREWTSSALGARPAAQALVVEAVVALARDAQQAPTADADAVAAGNRQIDQACRWLEDYYMTPVRVADLVALGPLGRSQFLARFRARTGRTIGDVLLDIRLREAQRMMRARRGTLLDVSLACGFGSQSHFNHRFRAATGSSPSAWLSGQP